jgi:L-threonylcarbamoyladenylate synthase
VNKISTDIQQAVAFLTEGRLVGIPTETVYGLAANALDPLAVARIFEAKRRPTFDPLIVHVPDFKAVSLYVKDIPAPLEAIANAFWPGPVTLLFEKKEIIPDLVTSGLETVAIRVPNHPLTLELLAALDFPLAAPSANPFGYISPTTAQHVVDQLENEISMVLDGGPCSIGVESTILQWSDGKIKVLRWGGLSVDDLAPFNVQIEVNTHSTSNPTAPGMLTSHYSPRKKMKLVSSISQTNEIENQRVGFLTWTSKSENPKHLTLSETGNVAEASQNLFSFLRKLDTMDIDLIIAEKVPDVGLGKAINDRLTRAAAE